MRNWVLCVAALVAAVCCASAAQAVGKLVYSFEGAPPPDGFFGLGATVTQDTIGTTEGSNSLKYDVAAGPGFVGARTESVIPAELNNPPGVSHVLFDMFIPEAYLGTFADLGITVFGHDIDNGVFGIQSQFTDTVSIAALGPGQHNDLQIDLDSEFNSGESFNEIFGGDVTDLDVASAFQFYISKNGGGAGSPVTVYIDNVRLVVPEAASFVLMSVGAVVMGAMRRRRSS
jgi:hypothetical protein